MSKNNNFLFERDLSEEVSGISGDVLRFPIGRSKDCPVVLDDKQVSREHAELVYDGAAWSIRRLAEFAPLVVNGSTVEEHFLSKGDQITVGPFALSVSEIVLPVAKSAAVIEEPALEAEVEAEEELYDEPSDVPTDTIDQDLTQEIDTDLEDEQSLMEDPGVAEASSETPVEEYSGQEAGDFSDLGQEEVASEFSSADFREDKTSMFSGENNESEFPDEGEVDDAFGFDSDGEEGESSALDGFDDDVGEKTQVVQSFVAYQLELFGEYAPYDKFNLDKTETIIGRDPEKCDIVLNDPQVSSKHAVLKKTNVMITLEDLDSGNGTLLNGERINKSVLSVGDEFLIGDTSFTLSVQSDLLQSQSERLMPVEEDQEIEIEEIVEVDEDFEDEEGALFLEGKEPPKPKGIVGKLKAMWKDDKERKKLIYGAVAVAVAFLLIDTEPTTKPKTDNKKTDETKQEEKINEGDPFLKLTKDQQAFVEAQYQLSKTLFEQAKYSDALLELNKLFSVIDNYKRAKQIAELSKKGLAKIEELEAEKQREIERKQRALKVKELVERARSAVKERQVDVADSIFSQILELDPENYDVPQLKYEIDAWKKEEERKKVEEAAAKAERQRQLDSLSPGKTFYLQNEWYKAIIKLEEFLRLKGMDEDLIQEGTKMLAESKAKLAAIVDPLLGKARSLKEGQDLKGSYETYNEILNHDPSHVEALNEMAQIRDILTSRSMKIYREAIVAESLSLFSQAKEKFQEVQQISPSDSEYYQKATDKLKDYLE